MPDAQAPAHPARPDQYRPGVQAVGSPTSAHLIVGKHVLFHGGIEKCEVLAIEGTVEASLQSCGNIEIALSGRFLGNADTTNADIAGRYEGDLIVRGCLLIRATGVVTGTVRYTHLEIERGGEISGNVQPIAIPDRAENISLNRKP
jgi:cytoskeletal protein CcmA (bactofilin family)